MVDSLIRLFRSTDVDFSTNGIGVLIDATSCIVTEERNGIFELEMSYPIIGRYYDQITLRRIIVAKSNPYSDYQPFRIFEIGKAINGIITVSAQHISYDMDGYPVTPFTANGIRETFQNAENNSIVKNLFMLESDFESDVPYVLDTPISMRNLLGGVDLSILDVYGGEYEFNNFRVTLHKSRGSNRGVKIRYGKNLTDFDQDENCSDVYTGVYPYWYSSEQGLVELTGDKKYIEAEGTYDFVRIYPLDLTDQFNEKPSVDDLRKVAENYLSVNNIGIPRISLTISFVELSKTEEYKNIGALEQVQLCDIITVEFPEMNVSATSKCVSTTYNVLTDRYDKIELGDTKSNLATTIAENGFSIDSVRRSLTTVSNNFAYDNTQSAEEILDILNRVSSLEKEVFKDS